jgi:peptidoglycan/xylan/chitin deacetylase (PgdA/CDA1 family)
MRGRSRANRYYHILRRKLRRGAVILMYHRVTDLARDPYQLIVSPAHFAQQLEHLKRTCTVLPLIDLIDALQAKALPPRSVAITFDDGYVDNYREAYPLLRTAGLPATIYVVGGKIGTAREFWWDDLDRIICLPDTVPARLQLRMQDQTYEWPTATVDQRAAAQEALHAVLRPQPIAVREQALEQLCEWAGVDRDGRPGYRMMTDAQLKQIAADPLIDIGGHTVNHPSLAALAREEQRAEIIRGRDMLEAWLGKPLRTFAYPYGTRQDYTPETVDLVRAAGFRAACTTVHGSIESGDDLFMLRRCAVFDWDAAFFAQQLNAFFSARA